MKRSLNEVGGLDCIHKQTQKGASNAVVSIFRLFGYYVPSSLGWLLTKYYSEGGADFINILHFTEIMHSDWLKEVT